VKELIAKYGLSNAKPSKTLMNATIKLNKDEKGVAVDQKKIMV